MNWNFFIFEISLSFFLIFHISDFYNLKFVKNNFFFSFFEGGLIFLPRGLYIYIYIYIYTM